MFRAKARNTLAGLTLAVSPFSFIGSAMPVFAQDYIDVEAERRAAQSTTTSPSSSSAAVSYGVGNAPSAVSTRSLPPPPAPAADNIGGLFNQVQQLQQEVMRLNGLVEQQAYEIRTLKEQSLERYMDIDRRLASGGSAGAAVSTGPVTAPAATGAEVASRPAVAGTGEAPEQPGEGEAYRAAYALVRGQEFDQAVTAFNAFLEKYPAGRYAPNAHYWLGELYLVIDPADPEAARQSFMLLLNQYPGNAKIPDALYKLGRVHFIKGNRDRSREYLNRVMREYPDSAAARLAGDFIDQNL